MFNKGNALIVFQLLSTTCRNISLENEYEDTFAVNHLLSPPPPPPRGGGVLFKTRWGGGGGGVIVPGDLFEQGYFIKQR